MIIGYFIQLVVLVLTFVFSFLPQVTSLPLGLDSSLQTVYALYHAAVTIFPFLSHAVAFMLLGLSIEAAYYLYKFMVRLASFIRGGGA